MMTTADLDQYVKTAAHDYLSKGVTLNDSITKLASTHGLNREQINRVVEGSNTEVYVQLFNQSNDKYIQFDNADSEKVASVALSEAPKTADISTTDYETSPTNIFQVKTGEVFTPIVEDKQPDGTGELNSYYKLAALQTQLENTLNELDVKFQHESTMLHSMVKQAVLGGVAFGDVHKAITSVYPHPVVEASLSEIQEKLAFEMPTRSFEKVSTQIGSINQDNPLIKQASLLVKHAQEFLTVRDKQKEIGNSLVSHIKEAGVFKTMLKNPKTTATVAAGGIIGGVTLDKHMAKVRARNTQSPLQTVPAHYQR